MGRCLDIEHTKPIPLEYFSKVPNGGAVKVVEYDTFDYEDKEIPSVGDLNPKYFGYPVRPVYIEQIIN